MDLTVGGLLDIIEELAPSALAEPWDNVGLQLGSRDWPIRRLTVALDPTLQVVAEACGNGADALVTHHPLLISPVRCFDLDNPLGKVIQLAVENRMAILSAHTNLDSASGGLNDVLAARLDLRNVKVLQPSEGARKARLEVTFRECGAENAAGEVIDAIRNLFASSRRSGAEENRLIGVSTMPEALSPEECAGMGGAQVRRVEAVLDNWRIPGILKQLRDRITTTPIFAASTPVSHPSADQGLGRTGDLDSPLPLDELAVRIKSRLNLQNVRMVGDAKRTVRKVALCTGSGASLLPVFFASGADVMITGDVRYHDARTVEENDRCLLDIGHFESEHLIVDVLGRQLRERIENAGMRVAVSASPVENSPFQSI
ncbi:MAG: Nif3-like dinuclear metal center hexameric protein [Desulfobacterales bacterium]